MPPKDEFGFSVGIVDDGREFTVFHDSWHEHIQDIHNAVICFLVSLIEWSFWQVELEPVRLEFIENALK